MKGKTRVRRGKSQSTVTCRVSVVEAAVTPHNKGMPCQAPSDPTGLHVESFRIYLPDEKQMYFTSQVYNLLHTSPAIRRRRRP